MSSDQVCRICLSVDVRMILLVPLKDVFEKVTNFPLQADKKPVTACYVCVAELKRCFKFITKSVQAEAMMEVLLKTQSDITPKSVAVVDREARGLCHSYKVTPVKHESFDSEYLVVVKSEPLLEEEIHVKEEGDPLTENMAVSEGEDDNSEDDIPLGSIQQVKSRGAPGSSQAQTDVQSDSEQPPLPLEVNIKVEDNDSDDGYLPPDLAEKIREYESQREEIRNPTIKTFTCTYCQKVYTNKYNFSNHIRSHTGERPHQCHICSKTYICKGSLKDHLQKHTGEKPFQCHVCQTSFSVRRHLSKHLKTHVERPYKCDMCDSRFYDRSKLKYHQRVHTGEEPCECPVCHRKFKFSSSLNRHLKVHTGEKPFECHVCKKRFNQKNHLKTHLRVHAKELDADVSLMQASKPPNEPIA